MAAAKGRCVIVSASPDADADFIKRSIKDDDYIICADGGIDILKKIDRMPQLIVGDFDSAKNADAFPEVERISLKVRKIDTDTMHCVDAALERGFRSFLFLGATGGRSDHALANMGILLYLSKYGSHGVISDTYNDIMLLAKGDNVFHTLIGTTISVIPFGNDSAVLSYKGLSYPLENGSVTPEYPFTISNYAAENDVTITLHSGSALVFFVKDNI